MIDELDPHMTGGQGSFASPYSECNLSPRKGFRYTCDVCGKLFMDRSKHREHVYTHSTEKPFVCKNCGHGFARHRSLKMHMFTKHDIPY